MKKVIVVTGGSGFVGLNLINHLLKKKKFKFIIDNYCSGNKKNHIKNSLKPVKVHIIEYLQYFFFIYKLPAW